MSDPSDQAAGGYRPAGWYYAQGDPPGTQRYWDGAAWQGDPQPVNPTADHPAPSTGSGAASAAGSTDQAGYSAPSGYGEQTSLSTPAGYGGQTGYADPSGYADQTGYADQSGYGEPSDYAPAGGYGPPEGSMSGAEAAYDSGPPENHVIGNGADSIGSAGFGGFMSTLFDTKFSSFITGRAISVVYILVMVAVALMTLGIVLSGLAGGGLSALLALILGPLIGLFYLVMIRMTLEFFVNQFRQTELLETIAEKLDRPAD